LNILFTPDGASGDFLAHKELRENDILVCVIDHHSVDEGCSLNALVVNSQLSPDYTNKEFSGVGMVYQLLRNLDFEFGFNDADNFKDLVSLGCVADQMLMTEPETRYYVYEGIKNLQNEVLKQMVFEFIGRWEKINPTTFAFGIIPKINGLIRAGKMEEKYEFFEALVGHNLDKIYENPKARTEANKTEKFLIRTIRQAKNAHSRQNTAKKKWIGKIKDKVIEQNQQNNTVIIVVLKKKDKFDTNLTGVIAGSLTDYYKRPVIITTENSEGVCFGSLRGYDSFSLDTKTLLEKTGLFNWIKGHENAAGVSIDVKNIELLEENLKPHLEFNMSNPNSSIELVDFILPANKMSKLVVENVDKYLKYWGKGIDAPVFAVEGLEIDFENIKISSGGMIKMSSNGVDYTQFSADAIFEQYVETNTMVTMNVIGTMGINEFMGKTSYQFIIDKFEITDTKDSAKLKYKSFF